MSTFLQRFRSSLPSRGFTLAELMVVITIMTLLTGVFLFQQRQFDSTTLLRSLAYSVALSIREAQTFGTSVRAFGTDFPAYGIYFNINTPTEYVLFADVDDNGQYAGNETEFVDNYVFQGNYSISNLCGERNSNDECAGDNFFDWMTVTFRRPNPETCIATEDAYDDVCGSSNTSPYTEASVQITGPGGVTRSVTVTPSGQISVGAVEI